MAVEVLLERNGPELRRRLHRVGGHPRLVRLRRPRHEHRGYRTAAAPRQPSSRAPRGCDDDESGIAARSGGFPSFPARDDETRRYLRLSAKAWEPLIGALRAAGLDPYVEAGGGALRTSPQLYIEAAGPVRITLTDGSFLPLDLEEFSGRWVVSVETPDGERLARGQLPGAPLDYCGVAASIVRLIESSAAGRRAHS